MITILLEPTDVLFFRDGRPMGGASSGHGAAWPLPSVISHAFHAALHRADFPGVHEHRRGRSGRYGESRDKKFGTLRTAGPFPVCTNGKAHTWFFPRPADAASTDYLLCKPLLMESEINTTSLKSPCRAVVVAVSPPSKEEHSMWWSEGAWNTYIGSSQRDDLAARPFFKHDNDFADIEHTFGIKIDSATGSVVESAFYSAHYLRLRPGWHLGLFAKAEDKKFHHEKHGNDLVRALLDGSGSSIIVGGQQRVCSAKIEPESGRLPLPLGLSQGFHTHNGKHLVKWVLLSPAIYPQIGDHRGGWLPSWIDSSTGDVLLLDGPGKNAAERRKVPQGQKIQARLVAALVPKAVPVTGFALPDATQEDRKQGGAKSLHLAVPAGAVYYFEADSADDACRLAGSLNWHGNGAGHSIVNRRSTLLGEQGFGLGVCGTWDYFDTKGNAASQDLPKNDTSPPHP